MTTSDLVAVDIHRDPPPQTIVLWAADAVAGERLCAALGARIHERRARWWADWGYLATPGETMRGCYWGPAIGADGPHVLVCPWGDTACLDHERLHGLGQLSPEE